MITFPTILAANGERQVTQALVKPAIYLDTWAIRLFAESEPNLGDRFRNALLRKGGTLVLSILNISEFTFEDFRHADAAGRYIDSLLPNIFFSRFDPFDVYKRELTLIAKQIMESPAGEIGLLRIFAEAILERGFATVRGFFGAAHSQRIEVRTNIHQMAKVILDEIERLHRELESNPQYAKNALTGIKNSAGPRATIALVRTILYRMRNDKNRILTINDAIDFAHCIVPAAYCDYVLLDRVWSLALEDARRFLRRYRIDVPIAQQVTQKDAGVERFLQTLEAL